MKLEQKVASRELSEQLWKWGYRFDAEFWWYENEENEWVILRPDDFDKTDIVNSNNGYPAPPASRAR